jgi:hypothetical protein
VNTTTSPLYGGIHLPADNWSVVYDCLGDDVSVEPDAHAQAWTKAETGTVVKAAANGMFSLATAAHSDGCLYTFADTDFSTDEGVLIEALLYMDSSASSADMGAALGIEAGENAAVAYLRTGGLNLDGLANVAVDLTGWHWLRVALQGDEVRVYVDDLLAQSGYAPSYVTCNKKALFGIIANDGPADVTWRYVRARCFDLGEVLGNSAP